MAKTIKPYIFPSIKRDGQHRHANYIFVPFCFLCACVCAIICSRNDDKGEWNVRATITGQKMGKQETTKRVMSFRSTGINKKKKALDVREQFPKATVLSSASSSCGTPLLSFTDSEHTETHVETTFPASQHSQAGRSPCVAVSSWKQTSFRCVFD